MEPNDNENRLENYSKNDGEKKDAPKASRKVETLKNKRANPVSSLSASDTSSTEDEVLQSENDSHKRRKLARNENEADFTNLNLSFKLPEAGEDEKIKITKKDDTHAQNNISLDDNIITKLPPSVNDSEDFMTAGTITQKEKENICKLQMPNLKIQPVFGGTQLSFPVHPRLTLIDLKDFILFNLNLPHGQQILSFYSGEAMVILSSFSESTILCKVPGLIDEITSRCAPVMLSFKMSSGMDFGVFPRDAEYEQVSGFGEFFSLCTGDDDNDKSNDDINDNEDFFEIPKDEKTDAKLSSLVSSLISLIPLPPGVTKSSKILIRSLSKASPLNNNLPTLWEIYFPEHEIKMLVTAVINVAEIANESCELEDKKEEVDQKCKESDSKSLKHFEPKSSPPSSLPKPKILITDEEEIKTTTNLCEDATEKVITTLDSLKITKPPTDEPKFNCEKCRIRCRPALRFMCKCTKTFCQIHRYPDQHECTFNHRAEGLASIQANNPKIVRDKIGNF